MGTKINKEISVLIAMTVAFSILVAFSVSASAATTVVIDFEDLNNGDYIGTHYPGLTFSPGAIIGKVPDYNYVAYPPHSGITVFGNLDSSDTTIDFDSPVSRVGIWYTSPQEGNIDAYDSTGALIDSASGGANSGSNSYLEVSGSNIAYVVLHDGANYITYDDLEYDTEEVPIPEFPTVAIPLLSIVGLMFLISRRKRRTD